MTTIWVPGMVHCQDGFDAEHCPDPVPKGYGVGFAYFGGSSAAHTWTDHEVGKLAGLHTGPIWVPTPGTDDPAAAGQDFLNRLTALSVPAGSSIFWDMERGQVPDPKWYNKAADVTAKAGYLNIGYGSLNVIYQQPVRSGYWVAHFTGSAHMESHPGVKATQYAADVKTPGGPIDQSLVSVELVNKMWRQPEHG